MEDSKEEENMLKERLLESQNLKGGNKTLPFIIVNETFGTLIYFGTITDMILYLTKDYRLPLLSGTKILYIWSSGSPIMAFFGAFFADCYFGRFHMICFGTISKLLGVFLLWLTSMIPELRPLQCDVSLHTCDSATFYQLLVLYSSFFLISVGSGAMKSCSLPFGADQLYSTNNPERSSISLDKYLSWYFQSTMVAMLAACAGLVYVQENFGWKLGFGIPVILMCFSSFSFFLASPLYVKLKARKGTLTELMRVIVISFKNRHLELPLDDMDESYNAKEGSHLTIPSNKLRILNKACIITSPQQILTSDKIVSDPSRLCRVDQVEDLKALIRVVPILSTSFMLFASLCQTPIQVVLVKTMDRHITPNFEIPAGSLSMFSIFFCITWLALYNHLILPLSSKIAGRPISLNIKTRMGIGYLCIAMAMASVALVESVRRKIAIQEGLADKPLALVNMSFWWFLPTHFLIGMSQAFNVFGIVEFLYKEFPKSMSSIASVSSGIGMVFGPMLSTFIFSTVDNITGRGGKESWVSSNINKAHFDYFFWLLSVLCLINFFYYIMCCKAYGPCVDDQEPLEARDEEEKP